jgi:small-conductance mechanosensitive channel
MLLRRLHTVFLFVALILAFAFAFAIALGLSAAPARAQQPTTTNIELETPRKAMELFGDAAAKGDFVRASDALDLRHVRPDLRKTQGPELARQLYTVLNRAVWIDLDTIADNPKPAGQEKSYRVTTVQLKGRDVPITLAMTATKDPPVWMVSSSTLSITPQLYEEYGPGPIESKLPKSITEPRVGWLAVWQWVGLLFAFGVAFAIGRLVAAMLGWVAVRLAAKTRAKWDDELVERLRGPMRLFLWLIAFRVLSEPLGLSAAALGTLSTCLKVSFVAVLGFAAVRVVSVAARSIEERAIETSTSATGLMRARGVTTQVHVLRRVINIAIGVLSVALMLTQFEVVRNIGVSLLASAGLAGVVLGFAAQRTIGSLIAGIQLSATQPIRIGDDVVIEKEFGVIEEITLTYVVVKLWDERRLIVPMTRFLEQPFENWTKLSAAIHGTVFIEADPTLDVSSVRGEVERLVVGNPNWDGRTKSVHVTDAKPNSMTIRVLLSATSASKLFELRAHVREKLLSWLSALDAGRYLVRQRIAHYESDLSPIAPNPNGQNGHPPTAIPE